MARSKPSDTSAPGGKAGRGPASGARGRGGKGSTAASSDKKAPKTGRLTKMREQVRMIGQAYSLTRKNDPKLPWILLGTFLVVAAVIELIGILFGSPYLFI